MDKNNILYYGTYQTLSTIILKTLLSSIHERRVNFEDCNLVNIISTPSPLFLFFTWSNRCRMARSESEPCVDSDAESTLCMDPDRPRASWTFPRLVVDPDNLDAFWPASPIAVINTKQIMLLKIFPACLL